MIPVIVILILLGLVIALGLARSAVAAERTDRQAAAATARAQNAALRSALDGLLMWVDDLSATGFLTDARLLDEPALLAAYVAMYPHEAARLAALAPVTV